MKKQRTSAEQPGSEERPTKNQGTSAEQRRSEDSSDEQPVFDGAAPRTFCVTTHAATFIQLTDEDVKFDMLVAVQVAMEENQMQSLCACRVWVRLQKRRFCS